MARPPKELGPILDAIKSNLTYDEIICKFRISSSKISELRDKYPLFSGKPFLQRITDRVNHQHMGSRKP